MQQQVADVDDGKTGAILERIHQGTHGGPAARNATLIVTDTLSQPTEKGKTTREVSEINDMSQL